MKTLADCKSGEIINWNDYEWIVIDHDENSKVLLMKDVLEDRAFDVSERPDWNNWIGSSVREYLNTDFIKKLDKDVMLEYESDLISDDGLKYYGKSKDKVFLISCDFYRKYREFIPDTDDWWWTITPWTLWSDDYTNGYGYDVRFVSYSGALNSLTAHFDHIGLRPACLVLSSLIVNVVEG